MTPAVSVTDKAALAAFWEHCDGSCILQDPEALRAVEAGVIAAVRAERARLCAVAAAVGADYATRTSHHEHVRAHLDGCALSLQLFAAAQARL